MCETHHQGRRVHFKGPADRQRMSNKVCFMVPSHHTSSARYLTLTSEVKGLRQRYSGLAFLYRGIGEQSYVEEKYATRATKSKILLCLMAYAENDYNITKQGMIENKSLFFLKIACIHLLYAHGTMAVCTVASSFRLGRQEVV